MNEKANDNSWFPLIVVACASFIIVLERAKEKKIAEKTLRNAMKDLGITSHREADRWFTGYAV